MKRYLCFQLALVLLCGLVMSGCDSESCYECSEHKTKPTATTIEASTTITEEATAPSTAETTAPSTEPTEPPKTERPFVAQCPYLEEIPAEACVFKSADSTSAFVQTIGADGIFTITEEVRDANGNLWGRLKSGIGWVNLSNPYCHGTQLPPVTITRAGKEVLNSDHHSAVVHTEYERKISFVAHETVTDLRIVFTNAGETGDTVYTMDRLEPGKPLVAHLSYAGDFYGYYFCYKDANGIEHSNYIGESLKDGSLTVQY